MTKRKPHRRSAGQPPAPLPAPPAPPALPPDPGTLLLTVSISRATGRWEVMSNARAKTPDAALLVEALGRVRDQLVRQITLAEASAQAPSEEAQG